MALLAARRAHVREANVPRVTNLLELHFIFPCLHRNQHGFANALPACSHIFRRCPVTMVLGIWAQALVRWWIS